MARPITYNRKEQKTVRFYLDNQLKKELKRIALEEDTTVQEILEQNILNYLKEKGIEIQ